MDTQGVRGDALGPRYAAAALDWLHTPPRDHYAYLQQVAGVLDRLDDRGRINTILDELEYLYGVLDPELQPLADDLIERLRTRLGQVP